ncbi:MAG: dihydroorotase [Pseudomonadales bacterium]|jgi:dihydroorotase|nr:dihydroorotase [Pseudomonadales bacterium]
MQTLTLTRPDDWHIHFRDGAVLAATVPPTARVFRRAIAMPNLVPPLTTTAAALAYRDRLLAHAPSGSGFEPLMTLYLTDSTTAEEIQAAQQSGHVKAVKLYPAGATTNSSSGVTRLEAVYPALAAMSDCGLPLLVHGEVTHADIDIFDREKVFLERVLAPLLTRFPLLRVVLEHITTEEAATFVREAPANVAATLTVQHLWYNRNHMLVGGVRPHLYCLPVLKRHRHQRALQEAARSGSPKFFLGTDSAPHARHTKESVCGCAGCFTAPAALELYAGIFEELGALDKLEAFASFHGPDFYGLPRNSDQITLVKEPWQLPSDYRFGEHRIVPLMAGETIAWKVREQGADHD